MDNNLREEKSNKLIFILVTLAAIFLPFVVFGAVYWININEMPIFYEKKDVLTYYGSIVGACFTGFITAGGLYYTLNQNSKSIYKQRQFDINVMKEQKEQFDKDYKLKILNQKLDKYKEIYLLTEEIINKAVDMRSKLLIKEYLGTNGIIYSDIEKIYELHNKLIFMSIFIIEPEVINFYNEIKAVLMNLNNITNKYNQHEINMDKYDEYYDKIIRKYAHLSIMLIDASRDVYEKCIKSIEI